MSQNPFLITPEELSAHLGREGVSVVDASWYLPAQKRFARAEYDAGHIPGAVFFDQDAIVEPDAALPHTLPSPDVFAEAVGALGIAETDTIVVYDGLGLFSAPRVWWMFRTFGARDVRVLDGGFPAWLAASLPVETQAPKPVSRRFEIDFKPDSVASLADMRGIVAQGGRQITDARSAERFAAEAPEPREGVRGGHMPGAANLPITEVTENGRLMSIDKLRAAFEAAGIDPDAPAVTSCGSGVTAGVLTLAYATLGNHDVKLYDGSWTEWGSLPDTPVETGQARR